MTQFPVVELLNNVAAVTIKLDGQGGMLTLINADGKQLVRLDSGANLYLGGHGVEGDIFMFQKGITAATQGFGAGLMPLSKATVHVAAQGPNDSGSILLRNGDIKEIVRIDSRRLEPSEDPNNLIHPAGGRIAVKNGFGQDTIILDGPDGDIILKDADCAEEFDLARPDGVEPGTVMVLDEEGKLQASERPYDKKVAGVVSGAGDYKPGLVLDRQEARPDRLPVALMGKVHCKVDAGYSAIEVGDLLTTSPTPGHAMRAGDPARAFGAVIGKALRSLPSGRGLIPILVALQ
ncbi:MAG TPA: hypothetical protein VI670_24315 [Thermoanaerobaculia bacterium]|jgi:hypothetical protein